MSTRKFPIVLNIIAIVAIKNKHCVLRNVFVFVSVMSGGKHFSKQEEALV